MQILNLLTQLYLFNHAVLNHIIFKVSLNLVVSTQLIFTKNKTTYLT